MQETHFKEPPAVLHPSFLLLQVKFLWGEKCHPPFCAMQRAELYIFSLRETSRLESSSSYQTSEQLLRPSSNSQTWLGTIWKTLPWETLAAIQDIKKIIKWRSKAVLVPCWVWFVYKQGEKSSACCFSADVLWRSARPAPRQGWAQFSSPKFALAAQSFLWHHQKGQKMKGHRGQVTCFQGKDSPTLTPRCWCLSLTKVRTEEFVEHSRAAVAPLSRTPHKGDIKLTFPALSRVWELFEGTNNFYPGNAES